MKPARITLRALWCDQGMAHMLQLYDTADAQAPTKLMLIDFGAEVMFKSSVLKLGMAAPAVNSVVETLIRQQEAGLTPKLDYVLISHQDTDHWSLLNYLMDAVNELGLPMKVGQIIYGGADWGKGATATVKRLMTFGVGGPAPCHELDANLTDYGDADGMLGSLVTIDDLVLRILIANAPITSKAPSLRKNGSSAVVVIDYASERMILPGDATWETLKRCNELLKAWTKSPVQPVKLVSAPHHGSLDTMTPKNEGKDSNLEQLKEFTDLLQPEAVVASAGYENSFKHPYLIILKALGKYAKPSDTNRGLGPHALVVYRLDTSDWQLYPEIKENIYTTVLSLTSPVVVADYFFTRFDFGYFATEKFEFFGPSKAMVSVPVTSSQVLDTKMEEDDDESSSSDDVARVDELMKQPASIASPRLRSIFAPPLQWMPPMRRVSAAPSSTAVLR